MVELVVEAWLLNENSHNGQSIQVTYNNLSRLWSLLKFCFLPVYRLLCQLCARYVSQVYGEAIRVTRSGELSDKCTAVVYVYYNTEMKICTHKCAIKLNCEIDYFLEHLVSGVVMKFQKQDCTLFVGMMRLVTGISEGKETIITCKSVEYAITWICSHN